MSEILKCKNCGQDICKVGTILAVSGEYPGDEVELICTGCFERLEKKLEKTGVGKNPICLVPDENNQAVFARRVEMCDLNIISIFAGCINSEVWFGCPPYVWYCSPPCVVKKSGKWEERYVFKYKPEGWQAKVIDGDKTVEYQVYAGCDFNKLGLTLDDWQVPKNDKGQVKDGDRN